ncbi:hypothetical protein AGABI1DRAFT_123715 [Agaricus bisporus var. burnettii JB137-S8]|uniref:DNA-directed DNA polymerase n=1 Tax=Agaricus bisporus var. burnettii (strain JB137-S8 / ATCC MYA-4627 / FGSC 10392) TaxID=597362 RepID=K5X668_AGABU|nr:uncharacterized protein AGABI1DRAFT_123715 [Agaricus bisporus var. burnettii JB137-S8]EKM83381.1 hypothetical protein AGABI1DRAFT_123715 [Agaricus bisporus var. burnettii JB137-S8]
MLRPLSRPSTVSRHPGRLHRQFSGTSHDAQVFKKKPLPTSIPSPRPTLSRQLLEKEHTYPPREFQGVRTIENKPKRNEVGVQLLSRQLHSQLFKNTSFPHPSPAFVQIAKEHLAMHGLDPGQGSKLADTGFRLPPLQGNNLDEHFYRLGSHTAEPWLHLAKSFSTSQLPPKPEHWEIRSGWTKYTFVPDGASYSEPVDYPMHDGEAEQVLCFDVESLPKYHPYAIMACAASPNAWYSWISPWLLEESQNSKQLIPLGDPRVSRVVVGHNVSYDRARVLEEYDIGGTETRFLDTMALHVAVTGISSHQRPEWMKYRKSKEKQVEQREEATEVMYDLIRQVEEREKEEVDPTKREELQRVRQEMLESVSQLSDDAEQLIQEDSEVTIEKRWEELTSVNSLREVAKLHCGITMDKEIRNDFMTSTPQEIKDNIHDYLDYCSSDVDTTHRVYAVVLPAFLQACSHPVSFAGALEMGSSFLTVNQEWERYLERAEGVYRQMEEGVKQKLKELAENARPLMDEPEKWQQDPWFSQLDWTPKQAKESRGITVQPQETGLDHPITGDQLQTSSRQPSWYLDIRSDPLTERTLGRVLPLLLRISYKGFPVTYNSKDKWHYLNDAGEVSRFETATQLKANKILSRRHVISWLAQGVLSSADPELVEQISQGDDTPDIREKILNLAEETMRTANATTDPWFSQLDWSEVEVCSRKRVRKPKPVKPSPVYWPKWYWDATKPKKDMPPGSLDITVRNRIAPLLLHLSWLGWPLFYSRQHGWTFRVTSDGQYSTRSSPLSFYDDADTALADMASKEGCRFYKLPHKDGEKANVGSPLSKTFIKFSQDGTLRSPGDEAKEALDMNAQCSYWISARDRIMNQLVVWQDNSNDLGFSASSLDGNKLGIIVPQVITMGAVTRRAIEKTWLTASNAKKNRVGSELKAMVRAPEGYAIVGADVDSEELWISSCMGDAQFGLHGATALGWMTLEGTKAAGTDLHSKTASILGISRDAAKVFNYSRIYGAGQRHALLLLLQSNPSMNAEQAQKLAQNLYASTKGKNTHRTDFFNRKFWYGGSESFVFNKLEEIALSDNPRTPALGCGITHALSKKYLPETFGSDYMTSRINWAVQSSGVDYLHLLIVSMQHLIKKYDIQARYLISVHDELRYLVKEDDKYRAALALQIANLWTRSFFAYKLGMDDLPQGVAFFSAVDIDHVLRKEADMPCVTPSQPNPIPPGETLDIKHVLEKTNDGSLMRDGSPMPAGPLKPEEFEGHLDGYVPANQLIHRSKSAAFLKSQATADFTEIKGLAQTESGKKHYKSYRPKSKKKKIPLGNGNLDWSEMVEKLLQRCG